MVCLVSAIYGGGGDVVLCSAGSQNFVPSMLHTWNQNFFFFFRAGKFWSAAPNEGLKVKIFYSPRAQGREVVMEQLHCLGEEWNMPARWGRFDNLNWG